MILVDLHNDSLIFLTLFLCVAMFLWDLYIGLCQNVSLRKFFRKRHVVCLGLVFIALVNIGEKLKNRGTIPPSMTLRSERIVTTSPKEGTPANDATSKISLQVADTVVSTSSNEILPAGATSSVPLRLAKSDNRTSAIDNAVVARANATPKPILRKETKNVTSTDLVTWKPPSLNPTSDRFCFIHIGKTAGTSVSCALGFDYAAGCQPDRYPGTYNRNKPFGTLPLGFVHMQNNICTAKIRQTAAQAGSGSYLSLATLRHPIYRLRSWFNYEQRAALQDKRLSGDILECMLKLIKCFPTFEDFVVQGIVPRIPMDVNSTNSSGAKKAYQPSNATQACQDLAWNVFQGKFRCMEHNFYNFKKYTSEMSEMERMTGENPPRRRVLALRSEHLNKDWDTIDAMYNTVDGVGSRHNASVIFKTKFNAYSSGAVEWKMSDKQMQAFCEALCSEIQVYKKLIFQSMNLSPEDKYMSIQELQKECPKETTQIRTCKSYDGISNSS